MSYNALHLYEEVLLLALKDKEGTFYSTTNYHFALGGALFAELLLLKKIVLSTKRKAKYPDLIDAIPTGDPILDESLQKLAEARRKARIETWINRFANLKHLKHRAALQLCERGILRADEDTILMIFKRKIYPEINAEPERKIIARLRELVFTDTRDVDPRSVILLSIAKSTDLLKTVFSKQEIKQHKKRIEQIVNGEVTGKATKEAIEAMQAAIIVACVIPAIAASTTAATS